MRKCVDVNGPVWACCSCWSWLIFGVMVVLSLELLSFLFPSFPSSFSSPYSVCCFVIFFSVGVREESVSVCSTGCCLFS